MTRLDEMDSLRLENLQLKKQIIADQIVAFNEACRVKYALVPGDTVLPDGTIVRKLALGEVPSSVG